MFEERTRLDVAAQQQHHLPAFLQHEHAARIARRAGHVDRLVEAPDLAQAHARGGARAAAPAPPPLGVRDATGTAGGERKSERDDEQWRAAAHELRLSQPSPRRSPAALRAAAHSGTRSPIVTVRSSGRRK